MHILDLGVLVDHNLVEAQAHIEDHYLFSAADGGHISADLVVPAHRDNLYIHLYLL